MDNLNSRQTPNRSDMAIAYRRNGIGLGFETYGNSWVWFDRQQIDYLLEYTEGVLDDQILLARGGHRCWIPLQDRFTVGRLEIRNYAGYLQIDAPGELADLNKSQLPKLIRAIKSRYRAAFDS